MKENFRVYASVLADNAEDARMIESWLSERAVEEEVAQMVLPEEIACATQDNQRLAAAAGPYDVMIDIGQVRILSKRYTTDPDVIPHVAVLEKWDDGNWLVAPFSPYQTPATQGEMATGIDLHGLGVIQCWNARTVPERLLAKSFLFGVLNEKVRENALALFRNQFAGTELPSSFDSLTGPEVLMESDPRCDYQAESVARLQPLSVAVHAYERLQAIDFKKAVVSRLSKGDVRGEFWQPRYGEADYALAAAGKEIPKTEVFSVEETELSVTYSPEDQMTTFTFYDCDNEPDPAYDGYGLVGAGEFLGTFHNGRLRVPSASVKDWYQIVNREGREVVLARKRNESDR